MGILSELSKYRGKVVEELQIAVGTPDARSLDHQSEIVRSTNVDEHTTDDKKLDRYWKLYKQVPIIRQPIRSFASEVIGPGYFIDTDNDDAKEDLEEWLSKSSIVDGGIDKDFRDLLKKATIQREVKGTAMAEKVVTDEGDLYGFKLIRPETMKAFTYPGQSVLLPPDANIETNEGLLSRKSYRTTDDGEVAAYVQTASELNGLTGNQFVPFTRDRVLKLTRDADVGEIFGESRLTAVEDRLESLLKKLEDNDKAIESLAHPFQLFQFGSEDDPWDPSEIKAFMSEHKQEDFEPGMKQGVQGNLSVETVSGEVAPIEEFLNFDVNWIISEMPLPKYALGGFEEDVNQFVSRSQETRVEKQIQEARHEIEDEWTPVVKEKAEELGYDSEDIELVLGEDPESFMNQEIRPDEEDGQNQGAGGTDFSRPPASSEQEGQEDGE